MNWIGPKTKKWCAASKMFKKEIQKVQHSKAKSKRAKKQWRSKKGIKWPAEKLRQCKNSQNQSLGKKVAKTGLSRIAGWQGTKVIYRP